LLETPIKQFTLNKRAMTVHADAQRPIWWEERVLLFTECEVMAPIGLNDI
jgi:hypothetical protein